MWLAVGGLIAAGRSVFAAPEAPAHASPSASARLELAQNALKAVRANIDRGVFGAGERDPLSIWSRRRMEARLDLSQNKAQRTAAAQEHVDEMRQVEEHVARMHKAGLVDRLALMDAEYRRLEAQSWLEKETAAR